jgi:23S rRNA (uracil1939-C5)-methyltransferase
MLTPGCEERCPGCSFRSLSASESDERKQAWLERSLAPWRSALRPIRSVPGESPRWGYRDKTCLRAEWDSDRGRWKLGLLARVVGGRPRDREVIDIPDCPVHSERVRAVVRELGPKLPRSSPEFPLVFVIISGALVTLVVKAASLAAGARGEEVRAELAALATHRLAPHGVQGVWLNFHPSAGDRVTSARGWQLLWGEGQATVGHGGSSMTYGPDSFQQLIPELYENALGEARDFLAPRAGDAVVDFCSGSGASLRRWLGAGARAIGVELGGEAVRCADANVGPGVCLRGRSSERLPQIEHRIGEWRGARESMRKQGRFEEGRLLAYANPPRLGLESEVVEWLAGHAVKGFKLQRLAYLSCSAGTLARDLGQLCGAGYIVERLQPYDFFPQTPHVETLALLTAPARAVT